MTTVTQPLRDEHRDLWPNIEMFRTAADAVGGESLEQLRHHVDAVHAFLAHHLIPHARAEEQALYPVVEQVMGAPEATGTMRRDHLEIGRLTDELEDLRLQIAGTRDLTEKQEQALRRVLYGLYTVVALHFAKEEEVYLPLLDARLTPDAAREMFAEMEMAAHHAVVHH